MSGRAGFCLAAVALLVWGSATTGAITSGAPTTGNESEDGSPSAELGLPAPEAAANDVLVAAILARGGSDLVLAAPTGWTLLQRTDSGSGGDALAQAAYVRVVDGSEPDRFIWTLTFQDPAGSEEDEEDEEEDEDDDGEDAEEDEGDDDEAGHGRDPEFRAAGLVVALQGVDTADPVGDVQAASSTGPKAIPLPAVDVDRPASLVLAVAGDRAKDAPEVPAGFTDLGASESGGGGGSAIALRAAYAVREAGAFDPEDPKGKNHRHHIGQVLVLQPPAVGFQAASSSLAEGGGTAQVAVALSGASSLDTTVTVRAAPSGTAAAGIDYMPPPASLTIPAGATFGTVAVAVLDDALGESGETVVLTLSDPTGAALAATTTHILTIMDADARIRVAEEPVRADGSADAGARWGAWSQPPGASGATSGNFLKVQNNADAAPQSFVVQWSSAFVGQADAEDFIPVAGNVEFACAEATAAEAPEALEYPFTGTPAIGLVLTFSAPGAAFYCLYRIAELGGPLAAQEYVASLTVTAA